MSRRTVLSVGLGVLLALALEPAGAAEPPPGVRVPAWRELSAQQQEDLAPFADLVLDSVGGFLPE